MMAIGISMIVALFNATGSLIDRKRDLLSLRTVPLNLLKYDCR
jgi:hypothetical protein